MNLNKLFPRLSIRSKLAIAFTLLAMLPLAVMAALTTRATIRHLRTTAEASLRHDLELARSETERSLRESARDVAYLSEAVLGLLLASGDAAGWEAAGRTVSTYLAFKPSLFQVKVVTADGRLLFVARASGLARLPPEQSDVAGVYYALRAATVPPDEQLLLPVELRATAGGAEAASAVPAVAILVPLGDEGGAVRGVVVGEAYASVLFGRLELGSPHLAGRTGLVDSDGLYLYHTVRKREWASLLGARPDVDLHGEFSDETAAAILSGHAGTRRVSNTEIVSFLPLSSGTAGLQQLILYRVVPLAALEAPVRGFQRWIVAGGVGLLAVVLVLAALAAHQFTQPIYQLREGARRLASGLSEAPVRVATNDELEDLAADFSAMATSLAQHRHRLEDLVAERTRALHETHAELTNVLEHSADAIIGLDLDGRVRLWNRGAAALFGCSVVEATGQLADDLLLPPGAHWRREAAFLQRELAEHGAVANFQTQRAPHRGEAFPVSLTQTLIRDDEGHALGSSLIIRDTRAQAQLDELMRRSERLAAVSVVAAGVAHELNTPLAILENRLECMEHAVRERCNHRVLEADLTVLREHARRMSHVTRDLLRFARDGEDEAGPVGLNDIAARVAGLMERAFRTRNIRLQTALAEELPRVRGSANGLETVCVNLLLNAADATPAGGTVSVITRYAAFADRVELEVSDTGHGVSPGVRERIFDPFFTTKANGTGLGLALCRRIVERYGGRIWVESAPGGGSRFVIALPAEEPGPA